MGGEKTVKIILWHSCQGSPPHGRGKGDQGNGRQRRSGITPAWAGKSRISSRYGHGGRDHPRMGGEKLVKASAVLNSQGSPPHGRGKAPFTPGLALPPRITPAWAGKRVVGVVVCLPDWDHPRMGGEKCVRKRPAKHAVGSPPHGRGKEAAYEMSKPFLRITPAWAGKSTRFAALAAFSWDHPRMGGEKPAVAAHVRAQLGSPPHGRGKVLPQALLLLG